MMMCQRNNYLVSEQIMSKQTAGIQCRRISRRLMISQHWNNSTLKILTKSHKLTTYLHQYFVHHHNLLLIFAIPFLVVSTCDLWLWSIKNHDFIRRHEFFARFIIKIVGLLQNNCILSNCTSWYRVW